jgi:hypothetical protein
MLLQMSDADNDLNPLPNNYFTLALQVWVRISNNTSPVK